MTSINLADRAVDLGEWAAVTPDADAVFARAVREWLDENLVGEYAQLRGRGGPGSEHEFFTERLAWNRHMAEAGWTCLGWPSRYGGRGATMSQRIIFHKEYARANAPDRVNHLGEELLGPTLIEFGTEEQKQRFLPGIVNVTELWAQGYSEPGAGSDLAGVATTARLDDDKWVINGQKIWTSLAHHSQWAFVITRSEPGSQRHAGLSFLLVPLDQPGVTIRPIQQLTGTSEFNEVFFDDAVTDADLIVGEPGGGWAVAMGLLQFERGVSTLGQQVGFARELDNLVEVAKANGALDKPAIATDLKRARIELAVMRAHAQRTLDAALGEGDTGTAIRTAHGFDTSAGDASVAKLLWANWHRRLGELAMRVVGAPSLVGPPTTSEGALNVVTDPEHVELDEWQRLYLFTRADTIYGGSNEVQRNIIAERVLGLPREARA
ncbi:MAG TPA: acyl-CoA dehydrogenase family protein [Gordonia sp. (in: high G+C Gram-positive bacteria)]|uniref:acyl-CoA dehydrogenase family protein n=1 Tax=unclassified Gordonia (in: high G+C Gram-positive bacteria) TaxID=2657482 RepID=UPI0025C2AE2E|nr:MULTISPECIES: acyl-CoA dehydrogenase family protein [unclassified Gordonia (in: high G+C Gram-positive bacteria)]HNP55558.1 acyl-CoA dehydrogenase family protein [Gordonia sp. (in: high G+C Gram-positive bacteria)]HRC51028.1 acyl-CoA dehydrogenase family protein [Gordonia sp. (in: high G+C Gram-positive bacteria)]